MNVFHLHFKRWLSLGVLIVGMACLAGCQRETLDRVDTADAAFSSAEDYAAYDREMEMLSNGQPE